MPNQFLFNKNWSPAKIEVVLCHFNFCDPLRKELEQRLFKIKINAVQFLWKKSKFKIKRNVVQFFFWQTAGGGGMARRSRRHPYPLQ